MKVLVTRLHQVRNDRGQLVVLQPGHRLPDRAVDTPTEGITLDEVANLKKALGSKYVELIESGVLVEQDGP